MQRKTPKTRLLRQAYFFFLITNRSTANDTVTVKYPQLELGSTATSYAPYAGQVYDIEFPSEAGTVYGGTLDAVSGVLTVTHSTVDLSQITPIKYTVSIAGDNVNLFRFTVNSIAKISSTSTVPSIVCSSYPTKAFNNRTDKCVEQPNNLAVLDVLDNSFDTEADCQSGMSGVQFVIPLAEPIEYQLDPVTLTTLLGVNNVWADTGDTSVTYRADTKRYIDKKLAALVAQIVNS